MHLPPFTGKWIDFPGVYSSVDDGLGGACASATLVFSSTMKRKNHSVKDENNLWEGPTRVHIK